MLWGAAADLGVEREFPGLGFARYVQAGTKGGLGGFGVGVFVIWIFRWVGSCD